MSDNVVLRRMQVRDLDIVLDWRNDIRVRKHMFNSNLIRQQDHTVWFENASNDPKRHLLILLRANVPFGFAQLQFSECSTVADWGFYVDPDGPAGQGKALGQVVLSYGFDQLRLHRITGRVLAENLPSINFHKHLGFVEEGILRSHHRTEDGYQNVYLFGLQSHEFTAKWSTLYNMTRKNIFRC